MSLLKGSYQLCELVPGIGVEGHLHILDDGKVDLTAYDPEDGNHLLIQTNVEDTGLEVYALKELPKQFESFNRAQAVQISGKIVRIGGQVFVRHGSDVRKVNLATPPGSSLYVDDAQSMDNYLFVTSRQKITKLPSTSNTGKACPTDKKPVPSDSSQKEEVATVGTGNCAGAEKKEPRDTDSSDSSNESFEAPSPEVTEDELSAYQSWSEASTEYSTEDDIQEFRPDRAEAARLLAEVHAIRDSNEDDDSSDEVSTESEANDSSSSHSSDEELLGDLDRFGATRMDEDEFHRQADEIYLENDGWRPEPSDSESSDDDVFWNAFNDSGFAMLNAADDHDGQWWSPSSDSDNCSECCDSEKRGLDGEAEVTTSKDSEPAIEPIVSSTEIKGSSLSQMNIYDLSKSNDNSEAELCFHLKHDALGPLHNSHPAIHPTRGLVVWPLGEGRLLFADFPNNTYFIKRLRISRMWSQHISISCQFSSDRKLLHVASLEQRGNPPARVRKRKSDPAKKAGKPNKPEETLTEQFDVILYSYRLSLNKTARAPPVLVDRRKLDLEATRAIPSLLWGEGYLFIACRQSEDILKLIRVRPWTSRKVCSEKGCKAMERADSIALKLPPRFVSGHATFSWRSLCGATKNLPCLFVSNDVGLTLTESSEKLTNVNESTDEAGTKGATEDKVVKDDVSLGVQVCELSQYMDFSSLNTTTTVDLTDEKCWTPVEKLANCNDQR